MNSLPTLMIFASLLAADPADPKRLQALPVAELLQEYEAAGLALEGTNDVPTDEPISRLAMRSPSPEALRFYAARQEIFRRGTTILPQMMAFAETEALRKRSGQVAFTTDMLGLLAELRDPRAATAALHILELNENQTRRGARRKALDVLERLTFCAFHRVVPHSLTDSQSVQHPDAIPEDFYEDLGQAATLYGRWLAGEGKDPTTWLKLARQRARRLLASEDPDTIYCVARFFQTDLARDDDPAATLARLAAVLSEFQPTNDPYAYTYRGRKATTIGNWLAILADYGASSRPHTPVMLRIARQLGDHHDNIYGMLGRIGGPHIMAYLFEKLPLVRNRVTLIKADPKLPEFFASDDVRLAWLVSLQEIRSSIDRNAGRVFATDDERKDWWKANRTKPAEQWQVDNLETLISQAEAGTPHAAWIAYTLIPDLPKPPRPTPQASKEPQTKPPRPEGLRRWLQENRSQLKYDPLRGIFKLAPRAAKP